MSIMADVVSFSFVLDQHRFSRERLKGISLLFEVFDDGGKRFHGGSLALAGVVHENVDDLFLAHAGFDIGDQLGNLHVAAGGVARADVPIMVVIAVLCDAGFESPHNALVVLVADGIARTAGEANDFAVYACCFLDIVVNLVEIVVIALFALVDFAVVVGIAVKRNGVTAFDDLLIAALHIAVIDNKEGRLDVVLIKNIEYFDCIDGRTVVKGEIGHLAVCLFGSGRSLFSLYVGKCGDDPAGLGGGELDFVPRLSFGILLGAEQLVFFAL